MAGGTNQMRPGGRDRRTGAPPGFTHSGGASTMALQPFVNPTTGEKWTASSGGWNAPEGWEPYEDDTWRAEGNEMVKIPGKHVGREWTDWKDPYGEAQDTRWGGYPKLGGLFGDLQPYTLWGGGDDYAGPNQRIPYGGGPAAGLFGSRDQHDWRAPQLLKYETIYN